MLPKNIITIKLHEFRSFSNAEHIFTLGPLTPETYANQKNDKCTHWRFFCQAFIPQRHLTFCPIYFEFMDGPDQNVQNEKQKSLKFCQTFIICSYKDFGFEICCLYVSLHQANMSVQ